MPLGAVNLAGVLTLSLALATMLDRGAAVSPPAPHRLMSLIARSQPVREEGTEPTRADFVDWVTTNIAGCMKGKVAIITGANTGIGFEVSRLLAGPARATTIMACRRMEACSAAADCIR